MHRGTRPTNTNEKAQLGLDEVRLEANKGLKGGWRGQQPIAGATPVQLSCSSREKNKAQKSRKGNECSIQQEFPDSSPDTSQDRAIADSQPAQDPSELS